MEPNEPELRLAFGLPKCGVLSRLKLSARNCSLIASDNKIFLKIEKSRLAYPGPRTIFRPALPGVGLLLLCPAGLVNAAVLNHFAILRLSRGRSGLCPGTTSGRNPG